jgi:hypothetical protein
MMETIPAIVNLVPTILSPSVKECTIQSIITKDTPQTKTKTPTVKNTLNKGNSFFVDILFHPNY